MIGFEVSLVSGEVERVSAERYDVDEEGVISFFGGGELVGAIESGQWVQVSSIGTRLAEKWPPRELERVIETVATRLGVHWGYYVHGLRDLSMFDDWRFNDLDEMTAGVFAAVGEDPTSSGIRERVADIRRLIAAGLRPEK